MSSTSQSITWQTWARKWGDWTTWFRKVDVRLEPWQRGLVFPNARAELGGQDGQTGRELGVVGEHVPLERIKELPSKSYFISS